MVTPVFVIGSGRCGTRTIYKLLSGQEGIEIYHEYLCTHVQQAACIYYMGGGNEEIYRYIYNNHASAIYFSSADYWIDCSNKLTWIIPPLYKLCPEAKFILLLRDGRKVVSSYFHKLPDEMYDDRSVEVLWEWFNKGGRCPPAEKKYWWAIPSDEKFISYNRFQRICWHWVESNQTAIRDLAEIPDEQKMIVKLEDLVSSKQTLMSFLGMFGINYADHFMDYLQTPQNVIIPLDFGLTDEQNRQFNEIAGPMMKTLGYLDEKEYRVNYDIKK